MPMLRFKIDDVIDIHTLEYHTCMLPTFTILKNLWPQGKKHIGDEVAAGGRRTGIDTCIVHRVLMVHLSMDDKITAVALVNLLHL